MSSHLVKSVSPARATARSRAAWRRGQYETNTVFDQTRSQQEHGKEITRAEYNSFARTVGSFATGHGQRKRPGCGGQLGKRITRSVPLESRKVPFSVIRGDFTME